MRKKSHGAPLRHFIATWTRSQVYALTAPTFDAACEKALDDRHLYTDRTTERLTLREFIPHPKEAKRP